MTRDQVAERIRRLMALAARGSGAAEEEARTAALTAVRTMLEHGLFPGESRTSPIDLDEVAALALHAAQLEQTLASERAAHAAEIRRRDEWWRQRIQEVCQKARTEQRKTSKLAAKRGARQEREAQGRAGGRARDRALTRERKAEIGRQGARERWRRWRAQHEIEPR
jgi:hypothetical protein